MARRDEMIRIRTADNRAPKGTLLLLSSCSEDTEHVASLLAQILPPNAVISINGDLGAGKTVFVRGLAKGLACQGLVASPTFMLLMEHPAGENGLALYHFDVYRLDDETAVDAFLELGFDAYFDQGGITVIEWGDRIKPILPERTLHVRLFRVNEEDENRRLIEFAWPAEENRLEWLKRLIEKEGADEPC